MERARKSSEKVPNRNVDRLSALPDALISRHILSLLPTQSSVQTSILAKRWRFLWARVPVLDFKCFPGTVCTVLLRHKAKTLTTLCLTYNGDLTGGYNTYEVQTCIAVAVERNVQNIYLDLRVEAPRCLFTCKTLVNLTMYEYVSIPPSAPIFLPNLKKLHLWHLECEVDFTRLISGCPVLEELFIEGNKCRDTRGCCISSPTLKRLTIVNLLDIDLLEYPDYMVTIKTPALRYLRVDDFSSKHFSISLCAYLVEAEICIHSSCKPAGDINHQCVLKLLDSIHNVKCLTLLGFFSKICDELMSGSIAKFGNLTKLHLSAPWCILTKFLESAHHLQVLTFFEGDWMEPIDERWACLLSSLRTVRIDGFGRKEQGFKVVRYILSNAQVLERVEIFSSSYVDWKENFDAIQRISTFPRESKKCELHFS